MIKLERQKRKYNKFTGCDIKLINLHFWCMTCSFKFIEGVVESVDYIECLRCDHRAMRVYTHYMSKPFEVF